MDTWSFLAQRLTHDPRWVLLAGTLLVAVVSDLRTYRIPNALTFGAAAAALLLATFSEGGPGFFGALGGLATGLALMLPLYALRMLGAGDVKLMAAVGAFLGPTEVLAATLLSFIAGGLLSLVWTLRRKRLGLLMLNMVSAASSLSAGQLPRLHEVSVGRMPYGTAIGLGTLAWIVVRLTH